MNTLCNKHTQNSKLFLELVNEWFYSLYGLILKLIMWHDTASRTTQRNITVSNKSQDSEYQKENLVKKTMNTFAWHRRKCVTTVLAKTGQGSIK
jgi:hypothetical protein